MSYKAQVLSALRDAMDAGDASRISDGAVEVEISAFFGRPKSHCRKRPRSPGDEPTGSDCPSDLVGAVRMLLLAREYPYLREVA